MGASQTINLNGAFKETNPRIKKDHIPIKVILTIKKVKLNITIQNLLKKSESQKHV